MPDALLTKMDKRIADLEKAVAQLQASMATKKDVKSADDAAVKAALTQTQKIMHEINLDNRFKVIEAKLTVMIHSR